MNKDRIVGVAKEIKGALKDAAGKIVGSDHIFPAQKPTAARAGRKVRMSRPIRKSIAFSSPLLLGIPPVQTS